MVFRGSLTILALLKIAQKPIAIEKRDLQQARPNVGDFSPTLIASLTNKFSSMPTHVIDNH